MKERKRVLYFMKERRRVPFSRAYRVTYSRLPTPSECNSEIMSTLLISTDGDTKDGKQGWRPRAPPTFSSQLFTMIGRNLLLRRRTLHMAIAETVVPCLFFLLFGIFGMLGSQIDSSRTSTWLFPEAMNEFPEQPIAYPTTGEAFSLFTSQNITSSDFLARRDLYLVGCTPDTDVTRKIMDEAAKYWLAAGAAIPDKNTSILTTQFYTTEAELEAAFLDTSMITMGVGVVFENGNVEKLRYRLRYPAGTLPGAERPYIDNNDPQACRFVNSSQDPSCKAFSYVSSGFVAMQNVLTAAYTKVRFNISDDPLLLSTKLMPLGPSKWGRPGPMNMNAVMPAFMITNLISFFVLHLVIYVVVEKERKLIANMQVMGMRPVAYWISWLAIYMIFILIASLIMLMIARFMFFFPLSDFFLILFDCLLFGASISVLGICVASVFKRPVAAGWVAYMLVQLLGGLAMADIFVPDMTDTWRFCLALLSPCAFFMGLYRIGQTDGKGYGVGWFNAMDPVSVYPSTFSFGAALLMLLVDLVIYSVLALYLEKVYPSDDRPRERPWFFLRPSYWLGRKKQKQSTVESDTSMFDSADIETVPDEMRSRVALSTHGLRKVFPGSKGHVAVHGFTYEMYEDEILAILGHNGAGKTTLINMISGMLAPTSGTAYIYGNDITHSDELEEARTMIGICPQHDALFDTFTVREHIDFYARLKGFSRSQAKKEFERIVDQIGMRSHSDVQAQKLSGGQRRRLSIAIAVVGNPKILILDEPTSGVDPYNQHFLWDMIRGLRKGRCVIITTQSMQEADVFADRKLIMSRGKLRCAGTSLFLKNRFGLGYHLTMSVDRDCDELEVEAFVVSRIKDSRKARAHAGEISFVLPKSGVADFPAVFNELDQNLDRLKIRTYGVSLTTMQEIFLKLADEEPDESGAFSKHGIETIELVPRKWDSVQLAETTFTRPVKGVVPSATKLLALAKIRFLLLLRSRVFLIFGFIVPLILAMINGGVSLIIAAANAAPETVVSSAIPKLQMNTLTADFVSTETKFFYEDKAGLDGLSDLMQELTKLSGPFEAVDYWALLGAVPHYVGYIFQNGSGVGGLLNAASVCFNGSAKHSIGYATNLLLNANFRLRTKSQEVFHVVSHPFPERDPVDWMHMMVIPTSALVAMALSVIPGIYGIDVCRDRELKIRSQIRMTGCSMWLYWGSAFAVHFTQYAASFTMIMAVLYAFGVTAITDAVGCVVLLFALHAPTMVLFSYCASFLFSKEETANTGITLPITGVGLVSFLLVQMINIMVSDRPGAGESWWRASDVMHYLFTFGLPFYGFFGGMIYVDEIAAKNTYLISQNLTTVGYFDWDNNIPIIYLAHAFHIPLLLLLLIYLESRHFKQNWLDVVRSRSRSAHQKLTRTNNSFELNEEDDDVDRERNRVDGMNLQTDTTYAVALRNLWKTYGAESQEDNENGTAVKPAVQNISMVFKKGEVFGLLGPNGAGKSTTLKMITGEVTPSGGEIHVNGFNMQSQTLAALQTMGSCPQTDTLWPDITVEEHMRLFAVLNDLPPNRCDDSIRVFTEGLHITPHTRKRTAALSGGTKRKLTFIISMIGNPPFVLLDEPSTGMDPQSKRNLWDMIKQSFGNERGAILTTHSMEEADALCDRIGIIVKGELQCIGSSQHLKDKFGSGYMLEVKLNVVHGVDSEEHKAMVERVKIEIGREVPGAHCVEEFYNRLVFSVPKENVTFLGTVFANLDRAKEALDLEEYSFSQTTIEQVFIHFARMQEATDASVNENAMLNSRRSFMKV